MKTWIRRLSFRGLSIQQRLPLLICVLLLCIIVTFGAISYFGVKDATLETGKERLRSITDQLSSMFAQSTQSNLAIARASANQEPVKKFLQSQKDELKTEALQAMDKLRSDTTLVLIELLNTQRQPILRSAKESILSKVNFDSLLSNAFNNDTAAAVGKIYAVKEGMYYPFIASTINDNKEVIGYMVRWRRVAATPRTLAQLSQLMGTKATLYFGNADKSLWTDMIKPVASPIPDNATSSKNVFLYSNDEGHKLMGSVKPIAHSPWLILVEFSQKNVTEAASKFLTWVIIAGLGLIGIGILIAWIMSRNITGPLNNLTAAASNIAGGHSPTDVEMGRRDEVGKLARAFNAMFEQVNKAKQGLEQKVTETIEVNEQLRGLSAYLQNVREDERIHIAREMHDELGQLLTSFKMDASWLRKKLADNNDSAIKEKLENMLQVIDEAVKFVRKLASELRPSILDDLGLVPALEWHSMEFEKRYNIKTIFKSQVPELSMSSVVATGLFRMYQESLTNVARHSDAKSVTANLRIIHNELILSISDDGKGFDTSQVNKNTLGLLGMKERAAMIGGKLEIISETGRGTTVIITVKQLLAERVAVGSS